MVAASLACATATNCGEGCALTLTRAGVVTELRGKSNLTLLRDDLVSRVAHRISG